MKKGKQGGEVFDRQQYVESVGCVFDASLQRLCPRDVYTSIESYLVAQHRWGRAVTRAATAEEQYIELMGETSRSRPQQRGMAIFGRQGDYVGYGQTKPAERAEQLEGSVRTAAEDIAERADEIGQTDVERVVWRSLGGSKHSHYGKAQLDMLGYASEAMALIEKAKELASTPILLVQKRVGGDSLSGGYVQDMSKIGRSALTIGSSYDLVPTEGRLDLVIHDAETVQFEQLRHVIYGGTPGLLGSARSDTVWARDDVPVSRHSQGTELNIVSNPSLVVPDIIKNHWGEGDKDALDTLRCLAGGIAVADQLRITEYDFATGISSSGRGDPKGGADGLIGIHIGEDVDEALSAIIEHEDISSTNSRWVENLAHAVEVFRSEKVKRHKSSLFQQVGTTAGVEEFFR